MLKTRLLTAAIALPVLLIIVIFAPAWLFSAFIGVLGAWALYEVAIMSHADGAAGILVLAIAGIGPLIAMLLLGDGGFWIVPAAIIVVMLVLVASVAVRGAQGGPQGLGLTLLGAIYVGVLYPYFAIIRNTGDGVRKIVFMLLLVIASDSGAYFVGRAIGRVKLVPRVSPNKTVEGAIGGLLAAVIAGLILCRWLLPGWPLRAVAGIGAGIAILAQLGDLAGSAFKRRAGAKDSGWIFPGHGGLIDRTCSLVFAAVFAYYCFK